MNDIDSAVERIMQAADEYALARADSTGADQWQGERSALAALVRAELEACVPQRSKEDQLSELRAEWDKEIEDK